MKIGIVPMGGFGERWSPYPCPKELLPFGLEPTGRPRVIADHVIERMVAAGVELVVVPLRPEKAYQVMTYYGHRLPSGASIVYVAAPGPTLVANLRACVPLLAGHTVLFGMPDTYFTPESAFVRCLDLLDESIELVLGCWEHADPRQLDTVEREGVTLKRVLPKPRAAESGTDVWGIAVWSSAFTERLAAWTDKERHNPGYLFEESAAAGRGRAVLFSGDAYLDIGSYPMYEQGLAFLQSRRDELVGSGR